MVRAILEGRKTQTRRVAKPFGDNVRVIEGVPKGYLPGCPKGFVIDCPYGVPGDRLWVKETWRPETDWIGEKMLATSADIRFAADGEDGQQRWCDIPESQRQTATAMLSRAVDGADGRKWHPSIFMPRWASRIALEIVKVRVERVQDISEPDAKAEGISVLPLQSDSDPSAWYQSEPGVNQARNARSSYRMLWDSINAKRGFGWDKNPWVWVVEFRRVA